MSSINQKILVALTLTAIIIGILNLALLFFLSYQNSLLNTLENSSNGALNATEEIPLHSTYIEVQKIENEYTPRFFRISVHSSVPDESKTMFNCILKMSYMTESDTWKTLSDYKGIIVLHSTSPNNLVQVGRSFDAITDFKNDDLNLESNPDFQKGYLTRYEGSNIRVELFGSLKP